MVLELRPAHDPRNAYGFAGVVISLEDLSASIWMWYLDDERHGKNGRRMEGEEGHRDPGGAGGPGDAAAAAQGLQGGAAARDATST